MNGNRPITTASEKPVQDLMHVVIYVTLGSAIGGPFRYFVSGIVGRRVGETFPWGTMVVNVSGAFAIGFAAALAARGVLPLPAGWQVAVTGFLGAYTTVSSFALQTTALARDGQFLKALGNVAFTVFLGLCAVALGYWIGNGMPGVAGS